MRTKLAPNILVAPLSPSLSSYKGKSARRTPDADGVHGKDGRRGGKETRGHAKCVRSPGECHCRGAGLSFHGVVIARGLNIFIGANSGCKRATVACTRMRRQPDSSSSALLLQVVRLPKATCSWCRTTRIYARLYLAFLPADARS